MKAKIPKVWGTAIVGTKGQVVIPSKAREELNIKEGDQLIVVSPPGKSIVGMIKAEELEKMLATMQMNIQDTLEIISRSRKE